MAQNLYRSAKGKLIDMSRMAIQHELEIAVSNVSVNARGDLLGPGGAIIRQTPVTDIPHSGVISQYQNITQPTIPTATESAVAKPASLPKPVPVPTVESVNALVQPALNKDLEKPFKGKQ